MKSTAVFPIDPRPTQSASVPEPAAPAPRTTRDPDDSFARAMKQAEAGKTDPSPQSGADRSESGAPSRSRPDVGSRGRTGRNSCLGRPGVSADTADPGAAPRMGPDAAARREATTAVTTDPSGDGQAGAESESESEDATASGTPATVANILVLPPPTHLLPVSPASTSTGPVEAASPSESTEAIATPRTGPVPALPLASSSATGEFDRNSPGLPTLSDRERLAVNLRQAIAHLEQAEHETPEATGAPAIQPAPSSGERSNIVPFPALSTYDNKIIPVRFGGAEPSAPAGLTLPGTSEAARELTAESAPGPDPQLPSAIDSEEKSAGLESSEARPAGALDQPARSAGTAKEKGFAWGTEAVHPSREGDGTSAARRERNMDSRLSPSTEWSSLESGAEHAGADNVGHAPEPPSLEGSSRLVTGEWLAGGETKSTVSATRELSADTARPVDAANSVERIAKLVTRETVLFRQHTSDSMAVVIRPDANTELLLHLSQRNGQIEANVRCERGDFHQLNALWGQLQESMGHQKVRLAPLQEAASDPGSERNFSGNLPQQGRDESARQSRSDDDSMEEWPAPVSPHQTPAHVRSRGGDPGRRHSTSRPGWETWA